MRHALLAFLVLVVACGPGWARSELGVRSILPEEQHVEIWTADGRSQVLHAVTVDSIFVSGVPWPRSPACDSCRVVLPRTAVDSLRLGDMTGGLLRPFAAVMVVITVSQIVFPGW